MKKTVILLYDLWEGLTLLYTNTAYYLTNKKGKFVEMLILATSVAKAALEVTYALLI